MGEKGARLTGSAIETAETLAEEQAPLGAVKTKKVFGGYGVFCDDVMFALVDSAGTGFFRTDDTTAAAYEAAGSVKHGRMPYHAIPDTVTTRTATLLAKGRQALDVARTAKR